MKSSQREIQARVHKIPELRFDDNEDQSLTSFSGLVVYQKLFRDLDLKKNLQDCFRHRGDRPIYGHHVVVLMLVIHIILGYRKLRDRDFYKDDPMVKRTLGLTQLPDVSTISRTLGKADQQSVENVRSLSRQLVLDRLQDLSLARVTIDFDGSVISTMRRAEGVAVGFNKKKKGARSYYPLFCTVAQTGQFLDIHHRPGNVHDSNGSSEFARSCIDEVKIALPCAALEARVDSAFFNEEFIDNLNSEGVEFTASVPFERLPELKALVAARRWWRHLDDEWAYFEIKWKPKSWGKTYRYIVVRHKIKNQRKGVLQLELFEPRSYGYEYKVIVTNKLQSPKKVLRFHNGRGSQEAVFAEGKSYTQLDYVPVKSLCGNRLYCITAMLTHNLHRELQIRTWDRDYGTTEKRRSLWTFESLESFRRKIVQRAGRLLRPQGKLTLVMGNSEAVRDEMLQYLKP